MNDVQNEVARVIDNKKVDPSHIVEMDAILEMAVESGIKISNGGCSLPINTISFTYP